MLGHYDNPYQHFAAPIVVKAPMFPIALQLTHADGKQDDDDGDNDAAANGGGVSTSGGSQNDDIVIVDVPGNPLPESAQRQTRRRQLTQLSVIPSALADILLSELAMGSSTELYFVVHNTHRIITASQTGALQYTGAHKLLPHLQVREHKC